MKEIKDVVETEEGLMLEEKGTMLTENAPVVSEELTFAPSLPAHMFKKVTNILLNINSSVE